MQLPDHVCAAVLERTIERYITTVVDPWNGAQMMWSLEWPLPVGNGRITAFAKANYLRRTHLPHCLVNADPMATIGLVVERRSENGLVRLLGRMTDVLEDGTTAGDHVRFAEPLLQTERTARPSTQADALQMTSQELWNWYTTTLLGKPVYGRPAASGYWSSRQTFLHDAAAAYAVLHRPPRKLNRIHPTQSELAAELGIHVGTLKEYRKRYGLSWSELLQELREESAPRQDGDTE